MNAQQTASAPSSEAHSPATAARRLSGVKEDVVEFLVELNQPRGETYDLFQPARP